MVLFDCMDLQRIGWANLYCDKIAQNTSIKFIYIHNQDILQGIAWHFYQHVEGKRGLGVSYNVLMDD